MGGGGNNPPAPPPPCEYPKTWSPLCTDPCFKDAPRVLNQVMKEIHNYGHCADKTQTVSCPDNGKKCRDCTIEWSNWGSCSVTCGGGKQTRDWRVSVPEDGGTCTKPASPSEDRECNTQACAIDCKVSDWSSWSTCNVPCGGGQQARKREVQLQPRNGGNPCPTNLEENQPCNVQACVGIKKQTTVTAAASSQPAPTAIQSAAGTHAPPIAALLAVFVIMVLALRMFSGKAKRQ